MTTEAVYASLLRKRIATDEYSNFTFRAARVAREISLNTAATRPRESRSSAAPAGRSCRSAHRLQNHEEEARAMSTCETCGNDYDKSFEVRVAGVTHTFDCFECAIQAVAPRCVHCGVSILGHGVESSAKIFCSSHCANAAGARGTVDRTA
jgi:hypothetical protein